MPDLYEIAMRHRFPKDAEFHGLTIPMQRTERFLAYDDNGQLWAYKEQPAWSDLASKWIPKDTDTPRLIITLLGEHVNGKDSIGEF